MMEVRPLHNEQDYNWTIREIARYLKVIPCWELLMETVSRFCLFSSRTTRTSTSRRRAATR